MSENKNNIKQFELTPKQERIVEGVGLVFDGEDNHRISYSHSTMCQTSLPFKSTGDELRWEVQNGKSILVLRAGEVYDPDKHKMVQLGLPYGSRPRLIMLDWNRQAILTQSQVIQVEDSLYAFLKRLNMPTTGYVYGMMKKQLAALAACQMTLGRETDDGGKTSYGHVVSEMDVLFAKDEKQRLLWPNTIKLSDDYFNSLMCHAVPLNEDALMLLKDSALELDLYAMLAERLHRIPYNKPQFVPWARLYEQYGSGYKRLRDFRKKFLKHLQNVKAVYSDANIEEVISTKGRAQGLRLHASRPPIRKAHS